MVDPANIKVVPVCVCCWIMLGLIFACIAIPGAFESVHQGRYALLLDWPTQTTKELYVNPGMKHVGLFNTLLEFPATYQTMYFVRDTRGVATSQRNQDSDHGTPEVPEDKMDGGLYDDTLREIVRGPIRARSKDGLEMTVAASFQWSLEPKNIKPLYELLGHHLYKDEFVRFARVAMVRACSEFTAGQFFSNREIITAKMLAFLRDEFNQPDIGMQVSIRGMQLREVDLPDEFDAEISLTQKEMQYYEVVLAEREEEFTKWQRELEVSMKQIEEVLTDAEAEAQAIYLNNEAKVWDTKYYAQALAEGNQKTIEEFKNDASPYQRLFEVLEVRAVKAHSAKHTLVDL